MEALSAACLGYALDHGYIAARDQKRAERKAEDLKSNWIGNIGDRLVLRVRSFSPISKLMNGINHHTILSKSARVMTW